VLRLTASNLAYKFSFILQGMKRSIKSDIVLLPDLKLKILFVPCLSLRTGAHWVRLTNCSSLDLFLTLVFFCVIRWMFDEAVSNSVQISSTVDSSSRLPIMLGFGQKSLMFK